MLKKNKKIIIIIAIALVIIGTALSIYFLWFKKQTPVITEEMPIQKLIDEKIQGAKFITESKLRFLSLTSNTFKEFDLGTKQTIELNKTPMYQVKNIIWSPDGKKAILKVENNRALLSQEGYLLDKNTPDGIITTWSFDLQNGNLVELPLEIVGIDWLTENKIIYYYSTTSIDPDSEQANAWLVEANFDGSNYQKIMDLDENKLYNPKLYLSPNKNFVILNPETEGIGKNSIYVIDLKTKKISPITENGLTIAASWSTKGEHIFLYQADTKKPDSWLYDLWYAENKGTEKKKLDLSAAYPLVITDKEDKYIYVAATLDNDQAIYQINSGSLEKKIIADSKDESGLSNITELGLINDDLFIVAEKNIYLIKTK